MRSSALCTTAHSRSIDDMDGIEREPYGPDAEASGPGSYRQTETHFSLTTRHSPWLLFPLSGIEEKEG